MVNIAAPIWNEIARTGPLQTRWAESWMMMDQDSINELHEQEYRAMVERGIDPRVALALLAMAPLVYERPAILAYLRSNPGTTAPAEINSVKEACAAAEIDYLLSPTQKASLAKLLNHGLRS